MAKKAYADTYRNVDFRAEPHRYQIGKGEQGALIAEPYKTEILPYLQFASVELAYESAAKIYSLFQAYGRTYDFVGMDMARKFLQLGANRARRYAERYGRSPSPATIFSEYYKVAVKDPIYLRLRTGHEQRWEQL
jgi:hypothetical protein